MSYRNGKTTRQKFADIELNVDKFLNGLVKKP